MAMKVKITLLKGFCAAYITRSGLVRDPDGFMYRVGFGAHTTEIFQQSDYTQFVDAEACRHLSSYFAKLAAKLEKATRADEPVLTEV